MRRPFAAFVTTVLLAFTATSVATGQTNAQKLAGQWLVRYERPATINHGETVAPQGVQARITLRQVGDSIFGAWLYSTAPNEPPALANEVRGLLRHDTATVSVLAPVDPDAGMFSNLGETLVAWIKEHVHGIAPTATVLDFTVRGDSLTGVRRIVAVDGSMKDRVYPLTGVRVKP